MHLCYENANNTICQPVIRYNTLRVWSQIIHDKDKLKAVAQWSASMWMFTEQEEQQPSSHTIIPLQNLQLPKQGSQDGSPLLTKGPQQGKSPPRFKQIFQDFKNNMIKFIYDEFA